MNAKNLKKKKKKTILATHPTKKKKKTLWFCLRSTYFVKIKKFVESAIDKVKN